MKDDVRRKFDVHVISVQGNILFTFTQSETNLIFEYILYLFQEKVKIAV